MALEDQVFDLLEEGGERLDLFPQEAVPSYSQDTRGYQSAEITEDVNMLKNFIFEYSGEGDEPRDHLSREFRSLSADQQEAIMTEYNDIMKQKKVGYKIGDIETEGFGGPSGAHYDIGDIVEEVEMSDRIGEYNLRGGGPKPWSANFDEATFEDPKVFNRIDALRRAEGAGEREPTRFSPESMGGVDYDSSTYEYILDILDRKGLITPK
jgi:hypothetical protein